MVFSNTYLAAADDYLLFRGSNSLQYRANCYGYTMRFLYAGDAISHTYSYSYMQQPGEFANKSSRPAPTNSNYWIFSDNFRMVYEWDDELADEYGWTARTVKKLVDYDMTALGYSTGQPITVTSSSMIPSAGNYSNQRLVALVTTEVPNRDYHFYVQNADNTLSLIHI